MRRRRFLHLSAGAASAASLAALGVACGDDDEATGSSTPEGTSTTTTAGQTSLSPTPTAPPADLADSQVLRTRFYFDLLPLDPAKIFGIEQENTAVAVYSGLTAYNGKTEVVADVAESWEQPDGNTFTFKLRPGVKWQQDYGTLTAEEVVASYNRVKDNKGSYQAEFGLVDSIAALNETTVQFKLKKPDANFIHQVANYHQGSIANLKALEKLGDGMWLAPVATGPFELKDVKPGQGFTLQRFNDYFRGPATLEKIEMRTIADHNTAAIALKNNELDVVMAIRSEPALDQVARDSNIKFAVGEQWAISLWMFNTTSTALGDPRVRQAMAYAVDLPGSIKATSPRLGTPAISIVPEWFPEYSADVPKYGFDLKKAKDLLSAAGVSNGINVKYMSLGNPSEFLILLQASMAAAGIDLEFEIVDRAQFNSRRVSGDFEITGRGFPSANVNQVLFGYLHPDNSPPVGFNGSRYNNPDVTLKLEAARSELDSAKRLALYAEVQKQAMTDLPYLPTNAANEYWGYNTKVRNVAVNRMPEGLWYDMQIAKA
ncbi:MAG: ABC transporter substrate-binding protein [Dehalococcoidia bacterium]